MSTNKELLQKGLIRLGVTLFLFILTPILITISFKALDKFVEAPKLYFAYALIVVSFLLLLYTLYFAFMTFKVIIDAFFQSPEIDQKKST